MRSANAVTDGNGSRCLYGFGANGVQINKEALATATRKIRLKKHSYKKCMLVNLVNSNDERFNMLARELENNGHPLTARCEFTKADGFHIIKINTVNYCLKAGKIHKIKE